MSRTTSSIKHGRVRRPAARSTTRRITAKVKSALVDSKDTKAGDIKVETHDGVVQLSGFVDNEAQKTAAGQGRAGSRGREVRQQRHQRQGTDLYGAGAATGDLFPSAFWKDATGPVQSPTRTTRKSISASRSRIARDRVHSGSRDRPDAHAMPGVVVDRDPLHVRLDPLQRELRPHAVRLLELAGTNPPAARRRPACRPASGASRGMATSFSGTTTSKFGSIL